MTPLTLSTSSASEQDVSLREGHSWRWHGLALGKQPVRGTEGVWAGEARGWLSASLEEGVPGGAPLPGLRVTQGARLAPRERMREPT